MFIDLSLKSMYSSVEHSTFELSWFLSHQGVMGHILESCKRGDVVISQVLKQILKLESFELASSW